MKCVTYRRVSTEMQKEEGYSLEAQRERLRNYIHSQGWELVEEYSDEGASAKNIERPGLQNLLRDMKTGKFEVVLVYRLDRLVRSVTDLHFLLSEFDRYKVSFKSATEVFDTTSAMGRLFITIVGAMAAWERENLGERVVMGMSRKAVEGGRLGAVAPWGYDLNEDGSLAVNQKEAKWVRWVFENYRTKSLRKICEELDFKGVRSRKGNKWIASTLNYVITNPVYYGALRWANHERSKTETVLFENTHEGIISKELFEEVQSIRENRTQKGFKPTHVYAFSGLLICGCCSGRLIGGRYSYKGVTKKLYRCKNDRVFNCKMPLLHEDIIEEWFLTHDFINDLALDTDMKIPETNTESLIELQEQLEKIVKQKKKLIMIHREFEDELPFTEFKSQMNALKEREKEINTLIEQTGDKPVSIEEFKQDLKNIRSIWPELTDAEKNEYLSSQLKYVKVKVLQKGTKKEKAKAEVLSYQWR